MTISSLFAQYDSSSGQLPFSGTDILWVVLPVIFVLGLLILFVKRYKRCPSDQILVVYGKFTGSTGTLCIHGGARLVLPLVQDYEYMTLEPMQIEVPLRGALSIENIRINVPSVFTVAIGTDPEVMQNAASRLLQLTTNEIKQQAGDIIFGQLRQVIASMKIEDINRDREKFLLSIQTSLEPELQKIGLVLINVNITDITDESGYIEAIGKKAASQAIQQANVDVAEQEKLGQIGVAEAEREREIQVANATKVREIGTREALRAQAVRIAELEKEQKVAEQTAAYQREAQIKNAEREMRIQTASANAEAIEGEAIAQGNIANAQADLKVTQASAYETGETRKREAEAAVLESQNRAMAKAAIAEAERVEAERRAQLEAPAKAEKAKIVVEAEAEAEKRRLEAEGEAAAIYAKLEARARGQYEMLAKKGDGLQRIIEACGGAQEAFQLLMLEHLDAMAESAAKAISNIKFDKVIVWEGGANGNGTSSTAGFLQNLAHSLPPMMQVMKEIGGVELPEYLAKLETSAQNGNSTAQDESTSEESASGSSSEASDKTEATDKGNGNAGKKQRNVSQKGS